MPRMVVLVDKNHWSWRCDHNNCPPPATSSFGGWKTFFLTKKNFINCCINVFRQIFIVQIKYTHIWNTMYINIIKYIYIYMLPPPPRDLPFQNVLVPPQGDMTIRFSLRWSAYLHNYMPDMYFKSRWPYLHWSDVTCCRKVCSHSGLFSWIQFLLLYIWYWSILSEQN